MRDILVALGRSLVKVLVSLFVGSGAGLFLFGYYSRGRIDIFEGRHPPAELFLAVGAGLMTAAAMLLLLFGIPWLCRRSPRKEPQEQRFSQEPIVAKPLD